MSDDGPEDMEHAINGALIGAGIHVDAMARGWLVTTDRVPDGDLGPLLGRVQPLSPGVAPGKGGGVAPPFPRRGAPAGAGHDDTSPPLFLLGGSAPMSTNYEGFCQFCRREIGAGHERDCPYYWPKEVPLPGPRPAPDRSPEDRP